VIGTVTALRYGDDLGWIGMLLVDGAFRRIGVGRMLLQQALDSLSDCRAVKLDATPQGKTLYDTLGFVDECRLQRLTHACLPTLPTPEAADPGLNPISDETWPGVEALDRAVFGADRGRLLRALANGDPARALCLVRGPGQVEGFCLGRPGANYHQVGPVVALSAEGAQRLARAALARLCGRPVVLDVPDDAPPPFRQWLWNQGLPNRGSLFEWFTTPPTRRWPCREIACLPFAARSSADKAPIDGRDLACCGTLHLKSSPYCFLLGHGSFPVGDCRLDISAQAGVFRGKRDEIGGRVAAG
jgi:hypothetical protein